MGNLNKVQLIGNLGNDPEVRYTQSGTAVCNFSLATNSVWKDKRGEKQTSVTWHRCVAWGKTAENIGQYLEKGRQAYVEGRLENREWTDKDDIKRYTMEVVVENIQFLGGGSSDRNQQNSNPSNSTVPQGNKNYEEPVPEDDIPF